MSISAHLITSAIAEHKPLMLSAFLNLVIWVLTPTVPSHRSLLLFRIVLDHIWGLSTDTIFKEAPLIGGYEFYILPLALQKLLFFSHTLVTD